MGRSRNAAIVVWAALCAAQLACGGDDDAGDGGTLRDGGPAWCSTDPECDDGVFCNGIELCDRSSIAADARGCVPAAGSRCLDGQSCDEAAARCVTDCSRDRDADGDGVEAVECGGSDCDDSDPDRFPGNVEVCDDRSHDEDCDPSTIGERDSDGDGSVSNRCCNPLTDGTLHCGEDCDDSNAWIHSGQIEVCDSRDNDCDGDVDEAMNTVAWYPDTDGDGFGGAEGSVESCAPVSGHSLLGNDCDDDDPFVSPLATDVCDGVDNDCDGDIDEACTDGGVPDAGPGGGCSLPASVTLPPGDLSGVAYFRDPDDGCELQLSSLFRIDGRAMLIAAFSMGFPVVGSSALVGGRGELLSASDGIAVDDGYVPPDGTDVVIGVRRTTDSTRFDVTVRFDGRRFTVVSFTRSPCVPTAATDGCDGTDEDCDGMVDEDAAPRALYRDVDGDGHGGGTAMSMAVCDVPAGYVTTAGDCDDLDPRAFPGAPEVCSGTDTDCDSAVDEEPAASASCSPTGTTATCTSGACVITACTPPHRDCDSDGRNGCEANLDTDSATCGSCTTPCTDACATGTCTSTPVTGVFVGDWHACVTRMSGRIACWGQNDFGQLGDGTRTDRDAPVVVVGLDDAVDVAMGGNFTCAARATGAVACWGTNSNATLGVAPATLSSSARPVAIAALTDAVEVTAGGFFACARRMGGGVACWGTDGPPLGSTITTPVGSVSRVEGLTDAAALTATQGSVCARRSGGGVRCWGFNDRGQLGDGTTMARATPVDVVGLLDAFAIAGGSRHVCAIRTGGAVVCWGDNREGQLGDGTMADRTSPVPVSLPAPASRLSAGERQTCALLTDGRLFCWGQNSGAFGPGTPTGSQPTPIASTITTAPSSLLRVGNVVCGTYADGRTFCFGNDMYGLRGDGSADDNVVRL